MKLNEYLAAFQSAKEKQNEIIRDNIENHSDRKESIDDRMRNIKEKIHNSVSPVEIKTLKNLLISLKIQKKITQDRISNEREKLI